jgi:hypothetical protein
MFIIIGPTKEFTKFEVNTIRDFVYSGGILLLSAGYGESESIDPILDVFGLGVMNIPLGSYPWIIDYGSQENLSMKELELYWHKPKFMDAYPLSCKGDYIPYITIHHENRDFDVIIGKRYGRGEVVMISDSRFLLDENLERIPYSTDTVPQYRIQWVGNIELVHDILEDIKKRGVSI